MKLNKMSKDELELCSYTDIAEFILNDSKEPLSTADIFRKICDLLELSDSSYENKIGDFYTSMTTDKRFVSLENALWDLRDRHAIKIEVPEDDDEEEEELVDEEDVQEEESIEEELEEVIDDDVDDELDDLSIVSDEELEEEL